MLLRLALLGLAVAGLWMLWRSRYVFIVRIRNGRPSVARGKVMKAFLEDVAEVCSRENVSSGTIKGVRKGNRIVMVFSRGIPPYCRQQLRNIREARR